MSLKEYQKKVSKLAKEKDYNQELFYLFGRAVQEGSEFLEAIWLKKSPREIEEEGADFLHFFFQMMDKCPEADIDRGMDNKIAKNHVTKKKTLNPKTGEMIRK